MDKKLAEEEALKKAKDDRHAAGKSSGMSGRDLVRSLSDHMQNKNNTAYGTASSSRTTQNGSRTKRRQTRRTGTLRSIARRKKTRTSQRRKSVSAISSSARVRVRRTTRTAAQRASEPTVAAHGLHAHCIQTSPACTSIHDDQCYVHTKDTVSAISPHRRSHSRPAPIRPSAVVVQQRLSEGQLQAQGRFSGVSRQST